MRCCGQSYLYLFMLLVSVSAVTGPLPTVSLGYQTYQATSLNVCYAIYVTLTSFPSDIAKVSGGYYNFSNIRYAAPPIGDLRFAKPVPPRGINNTIDDGSVGRICPGVQPTWLGLSGQFVDAYVNDKPFNFTAANASFYADTEAAIPTPSDARTTEDCLFLDVFAPQKSFDLTKGPGNSTKGSPVLVWIYGGGFSYGDKTSVGNPAGLIKASSLNSSNEIIVVALNYRVRLSLAIGFS